MAGETKDSQLQKLLLMGRKAGLGPVAAAAAAAAAACFKREFSRQANSPKTASKTSTA